MSEAVPKDVRDNSATKWRVVISDLEEGKIDAAMSLALIRCPFCSYFEKRCEARHERWSHENQCRVCPLHIEGKSIVCHPAWDSMNDLAEVLEGDTYPPIEAGEEETAILLECAQAVLKAVNEVEVIE
jgi:hypothetical protein